MKKGSAPAAPTSPSCTRGEGKYCGTWVRKLCELTVDKNCQGSFEQALGPELPRAAIADSGGGVKVRPSSLPLKAPHGLPGQNQAGEPVIQGVHHLKNILRSPPKLSSTCLQVVSWALATCHIRYLAHNARTPWSCWGVRWVKPQRQGLTYAIKEWEGEEILTASLLRSRSKRYFSQALAEPLSPKRACTTISCNATIISEHLPLCLRSCARCQWYTDE